MKEKVSGLEEQLVKEMEQDAVVLAQAQASRADQGFFSNIRGMAEAVTTMRAEQRHTEASAALSGMLSGHGDFQALPSSMEEQRCIEHATSNEPLDLGTEQSKTCTLQ